MLIGRLGLLCAMSVCVLGAQDLPKGQVIDEVKCQADATQSYALYLPSNYSPDKKWPVLMGFDARARGRNPVERYQAAAEKYGYIVAGSNNSRNGPVQVSGKAARAMEADILARFSVDPKRLYITGQSGGARFSIDLAGSARDGYYAGVIASSAGFPRVAGTQMDLPYAVFGTAGTEDFNYLELRRLDRNVVSAHHVRIFNGGHTWPPAEVATEAIEWMEVQAMRTGARAKDEALIDKVFNLHKAELAATTDAWDVYQWNLNLSVAFAGLRDVGQYGAKAKEMEHSKEVIDAIRKIGQAELEEGRLDAEISNLAEQLGNEAEREECLNKLKQIFAKLGADARAAEDTPARRSARRVIYGTLADNGQQNDAEYKKMLEALRP